MKKFTAVILGLLLIIPFSYSEQFKIAKGIYNTKGKFKFTTTNATTLEMKYPLDKKTVFTEESLDSYIKNYTQQLKNSRFFQEIDVHYELTGQTDEDVNLVNIIVSVVDSNHFLAVPYASFKDDSTITQVTPKIKAKDTNFLGSMNPLTADINVEIAKKADQDFWTFSPGFNIEYDFPFKAGIFDLTWVNAYNVQFKFGDSSPEWKLKTGLKAELPFDRVSLILEGYQYSIRENDYSIYNDEIFFQNEVAFSAPIKLYKFSNFSTLTYTPAVNFKVNYDFDSINNTNYDLKGPFIAVSHKISNSKIDWNNNFRNGYMFSITNTWPYDFYLREWYPSVSIEGMFFRSFKVEDRNYLDTVGIAVDLYAFTYFDFPSNRYDKATSGYGEKIGARIRGVPDGSYFGNAAPDYTTSTAVVMNIDFPINIITTTFKRDIINFNMQFAPFMDIAIYRDRALPMQTESVICMGMEVLVYPYKWSSFTIRGSIGFDMKRAISEDKLLKGLWHNKEFSIGLGLHY